MNNNLNIGINILKENNNKLPFVVCCYFFHLYLRNIVVNVNNFNYHNLFGRFLKYKNFLKYNFEIVKGEYTFFKFVSLEFNVPENSVEEFINDMNILKIYVDFEWDDDEWDDDICKVVLKL